MNKIEKTIEVLGKYGESGLSCKTININQEALEQQLDDRWIPASERLPNENERFHAWVILKHVDRTYFFTVKTIWERGKFTWFSGKELDGKWLLIAWMPLTMSRPYDPLAEKLQKVLDREYNRISGKESK